MENKQSGSAPEKRLVAIPPVRKSVRTTRGVAPLRYSHVTKFSSLSKLPKSRKGNKLVKSSAIDQNHNSDFIGDKAQSNEAGRSVQTQQQEAHNSALHERSECVATSEQIERVSKSENDMLKGEIAALRNQIAELSMTSVCENPLKYLPMTSTPHTQNLPIPLIARETTEYVRSSTSNGNVRSQLETDYMSALSGSESTSTNYRHHKRSMTAAEIQVKMRELEKEYECQHKREQQRAYKQTVQAEVHFSEYQQQQQKPKQFSSSCVAPSSYVPPLAQLPSSSRFPSSSCVSEPSSSLHQLHQQQPGFRPEVHRQQFDQWPSHQQQQQYQQFPARKLQQQRQFAQPQFEYSSQQQTQFAQPQYEYEQQQQRINQQMPSDFHRYLLRQGAKDLPRFDGNPEDWLMFSTQFWRTTREGQFSMDENLSRLQRSLHGPARECVRSLLVLPQCVDEIMQTLHERYGRDEFIIKGLINKTRRVVSPRDDQPQSIIEYATIVNNMVVTLKSLGRYDYLQNPQLLEDIETKLPPMLSMLWSNAMMGMQRYTLDNLNNWLHQQAKVLSLRSVPKDDKRKPVHKVFAASENNNSSSTCEPCVCCKQQCESIAKCRKFAHRSIEERFDLAKKEFLCFSCLCPGHSSARCRRKLRCTVDNCGARHNTLLHTQKTKPKSVDKSKNSSLDERETCATIPSAEKRTLLKVIPVILRVGETEVCTSALLDSGSTVTLLRADIANKLGATGPAKAVCIQWGDGQESHERNSQVVNIFVKGSFSGARQFSLQGVKTVQRLPQYSQSVNKNRLQNKWPHLCGIPFAEYEGVQLGILIGEDNAFAMAPQRIIKDQSQAPIATKTPLGWVVSGKVSSSEANETSFVHHACDEVPGLDELHRLVKSSFVMDDFGVKVNQTKGRSREDERAFSLMKTTAARMSGHRWEIGLLWRDEDTVLPDSKNMAMLRLQCLERRLDRDNVLRASYSEKITDYIEKGYFVRATINSEQNRKKWYLPHFPVVNPNKPNKLRIVFDAAAKSHGQSLNDFLMTGPDLLKPLPGVLFRFRQRRIGFVGDIKEMYHRVGIRAADQFCQLILWRGDDRQREPDIYKMTAMTFGASCSPSAAMFIKDTNAQEFAHKYPDATKVIVNNHYVDDCLSSADDVASATKLVNDICWVHAQGGFEIRNWACSSQKVLESIPAELRSVTPKQIMCDQMERILGIWWDSLSDTFTFRLKQQHLSPVDVVQTKRHVLRVIMTIYDPLGMLAHILIRGKIIMQSVWKSGIGWDDELTPMLFDLWRKWLRDLAGIERVRVPRCYSFAFSSATNIQLHIFCDASEQAYCTVAYFRIQVEESIEVAFVVAKARVAPLKTSTIPRLELQAALIGSRIAGSIVAEHEVKPHRIVMWSDSRTVLAWVRAEDRRFRQYVSQRVGEILENTNKSSWRWVPTQQNVADDATRMNSSISFELDGRWYSGPSFLRKSEHEWPVETVKEASDTDMETIQTVCVIDIPSSTFKFERYSSLIRLVRVAAWMMRFIERLRTKTSMYTGELSVSELKRGEEMCLKAVQRECFSEEVRLVSAGEPLEKRSRLFRLCPRLGSEKLLRVGGRLDRLDADENYKNPIIIDGCHRFCVLLLRKFHNRYNHQNDNTVLNEIRQTYWVIGARRELKRLKQTCPECIIRRASPELQLMGQLPRVRLEYGFPPFTRTGVDYFGPIEVAVGRRREKRYGVLFTCMASRAVHIDVAASMSTDSFLMAWRRFVSRRGVPKEMLSDNGTNFRGADAEMAKSIKELDNDAIRAVAASRGMSWSFIPPGSPHFGGCWERLVRSIKSSLSVTLKNRRPPSDELLHTLLVEAENVVNSRPLTELPLDHSGDDVITPNHLLIGRSSADAPIGKFTDQDLLLRKQWRAAQRLADVFWSTWVRSYLPTLTLRPKWHKLGRKLSVGDVVLVADGNEARNSWPRGIIDQIHPGADGVVRVVDVRLASGTIRRPVHKICLLVVADSSAHDSVLTRQSNTERENVGEKTAK